MAKSRGRPVFHPSRTGDPLLAGRDLRVAREPHHSRLGERVVIGARFDDLAAQLRELLTPRPGGRVAVLTIRHDHGCPAVAIEGQPAPGACRCEPDLEIREVP